MSCKNYDLNGRKKQGQLITIFTDDNGFKSVDYRNTLVVTEIDSNTVRLNNGGWYSVTSKVVMNRYFSQKGLDIRVFQKNHVWYVKQGDEVFEYVNNKNIDL